VSVTRVAYTVEGWGEGEIWFEGGRLVWHELPHPRATVAEEPRPMQPPRRKPHPHPVGGRGSTTRLPLRSTVPAKSARGGDENGSTSRRFLQSIERYFAGEPVSFDDVEIDVDGLTPFQLETAAALRRVPYGSFVSYRDLARAAGYPNAQRAAGSFCAHNRYPLVLPCHRVVSSSGIGSYGSLGAGYKRRLLELEGVAL
jgi:methylated-DNA-[protein]-cysteine S-methyltransferase